MRIYIRMQKKRFQRCGTFGNQFFPFRIWLHCFWWNVEKSGMLWMLNKLCGKNFGLKIGLKESIVKCSLAVMNNSHWAFIVIWINRQKEKWKTQRNCERRSFAIAFKLANWEMNEILLRRKSFPFLEYGFISQMEYDKFYGQKNEKCRIDRQWC